MTDSEKNAVNKMKIQLARLVIDLDDKKLLEIIKASLKEHEADDEKTDSGLMEETE